MNAKKFLFLILIMSALLSMLVWPIPSAAKPIGHNYHLSMRHLDLDGHNRLNTANHLGTVSQPILELPNALADVPLETTPSWTGEGNLASAYFGFSVGTAGDVNGDGYDDVIVGSHGYSNGQTNEGRVYVYYGSSSGISASPDWMVESDQINAELGYSVGTAGDVNGDGFSDVIIGARRYSNGQEYEGGAFVYHGSKTGLSNTPNWSAEGNKFNVWFGISVATAGDVNNDGYDDVIVGVSNPVSAPECESTAYVYYGSDTGLSSSANWSKVFDQADACFGYSVATAGDVNGDGYSDVIIGAPYYENVQAEEGAAFVFQGSDTGLSSDPVWSAESDQADCYFGISVGTAGDVNNDGYDDVIVGAPYYTNDESEEGRVFVYLGSDSGLSTSVDWFIDGNQSGSEFGGSVGTAGDVNDDGYWDVLIGAPTYNGGYNREGSAFLYTGTASGLSVTADWTTESDISYAYYGNSVGTAGDVNGNGYSDVIVGAYGFDEFKGRAYVYHDSEESLSFEYIFLPFLSMAVP